MKGRADIAKEIGLPAWKQVLFGKVLPSPGIRAAATAAATAAQKLLAKSIPTGSGLHYRFPEAFGLSGRTLPALSGRSFTASLPPGEAVAGEAMLFVGCVFDHVYPQIGRASYETMKASGKEIAVFRDAACCGLPAMASGDRDSALRCAEENVRRLRDAAPSSVVFPCGSCLVMFRRNLLSLIPETHPLHGDAAWVSGRCVDYASFILVSGVAERLPEPREGREDGKIGYHDPCHLSGTLGKGGEAREVLMRAVGPSFEEMRGAHLCCGYGGAFNVRDYATSSRIGENKVSVAARGGTGVIATACSGCILQMRDMAARSGSSLRVAHVAELVSAALARR